jgi:YVTN family beta-propeller protein
VLSPINGVDGECQGVNVIYRDLMGRKKDTLDWYTPNFAGELVLLPSSQQPIQAIPIGLVLDEPRPRPRIKSPVNVCDNICIAQMNSGSEFISYIDIPVIEEVIPCVDCTNKDIDLSSQNLNLGYMVNNSDNSKVYVSDFGGKIIVINTLTDTIATTITGLGYGIRYMVYHPTNNILYVVNKVNNTVILIDTLTDTVIGSPINVGTSPEHIVYVTYNNYVYVTNFMSSDVIVIDTATNLVVTTISVGNEPFNIIYNSDLKLLYIFNVTDGTISVIDVVTNSVTATINVGSGTSSIYGNYVGYNQHLYVYNSVDGEILVIDTTTNDIIGNPIPVNNSGYEFTYNPSNKYLYLTSGLGVVVINTENDTIVTTLNVISEKAIYVPLTNNIYTGYGNGTLTTINNLNTSIGTNTVFPKSQYSIFNPANESIYVCGPYGINIIKCVNNKPKSQTNIRECTLGVRISNSLIENLNTLTAITSGGVGPFTYLWSNGATTSSINVTNSGNYSVKVTDTSTCCMATAEFQIADKKACWFTMVEKPEYVMGAFYQNLYGVCTMSPIPTDQVTFNVLEVTVNGNPITIPSPPLSTTLTPDNVNWVSAVNDIVYQCTPGNVTGQTYTNYVEFLNSVFNTLGLTDYKAQVSLKAQKVGDAYYNDNNGFYIIYPATDTFKIKTESTNNIDKYIYSNEGVTDWNPSSSWLNYKKSFCDGIVVTNGVVIE